MIGFVYCKGGNKPAPRIANEGGAAYGMRGDYTAYDRCSMLDFDFHSEPTQKKWLRFLSVIREHQPEMALVPDFFEWVKVETLHRQIDEVLTAGAKRVAVCPKFTGAVAYIPQHCIIALSVPTTYAGFLPIRDELIGRELHLLGGHPDQQAFCIFHRYAGLNVISADGNIAGRKGELGQYWDAEKNGWVTTTKNSMDSVDLAILSIQNTRATLTNAPTRYKSKRVRAVAQLNLFETEQKSFSGE